MRVAEEVRELVLAVGLTEDETPENTGKRVVDIAAYFDLLAVFLGTYLFAKDVPVSLTEDETSEDTGKRIVSDAKDEEIEGVATLDASFAMDEQIVGAGPKI